MEKNEYLKQVLEAQRTEAVQRDWLLVTGSAALLLGLVQMFNQLPKLVGSSQYAFIGGMALLGFCMITVLISKSTGIHASDAVLELLCKPDPSNVPSESEDVLKARRRRNQVLNWVASSSFILGVICAVIYAGLNVAAQEYGTKTSDSLPAAKD